jgi:hypothetical protein
LQVFQTHVSSVFFYMLQLLYLDVLKVDQVLHIGCTWEAADSAGESGETRARCCRALGRSLASPIHWCRSLADERVLFDASVPD